MAERPDLARAGYLPWANDPSGRTFIAPDGHRLLTEAEAIRELEKRIAEQKAGKR
jgi:hypothetical protein